MPLSHTQAGRLGELMVIVLAVAGSDGDLEVFRPETDDDHVDLAVARKGGDPRLGVQVKTATRLNPAGFVHATGYLVEGVPRTSPGYFYAVVWLDGITVRATWWVPSADFNRLVYRSGDQLIFEAYPEGTDRWSPYRLAPEALGRQVLAALDGLPEGFRLELGAARPPDRDRDR